VIRFLALALIAAIAYAVLGINVSHAPPRGSIWPAGRSQVRRRSSRWSSPRRAGGTCWFASGSRRSSSRFARRRGALAP